MGNVLHLDERHRRVLEADAWWGCEADESGRPAISCDLLMAFMTLVGGESYLHSAIPSFSASKRSPATNRSPSISSIQVLTSLAAWGVYFDRRKLRMSLSREDTEAMIVSFPQCYQQCIESTNMLPDVDVLPDL